MGNLNFKWFFFFFFLKGHKFQRSWQFKLVLWPKCQNSTIYQNIYQFTTVSKIYRDLSLFGYLSLENSSFPWYSSSMNLSSMEKFWNFFIVLKFHKLEFHKKIYGNFEGNFFKELEFMELKLHSKLEFQKGGRSLHIFKIVVDWLIFW